MALKPFDEYVRMAGEAHGHMCAGQILGLRLAIHGLELLGLDDPTGAHRKRLVTFVEIDRCATDAVTVVTGCRLGKRALKFRDFGKVAATFCDLETGRAVRVVALESSKQKAAAMFPDAENRNSREILAYRQLPAADLFSHRWVRVRVGAEDLPGYKGPKAVCAQCAEGINFAREVERDGRVLCRACAGEQYWEDATA